MSILSAIRSYVLAFPELKDGALLVDILSSKPVAYSVETVPCSPVYRQYTDGGCLKQFLFLFSSREPLSLDVNQCIQNMAFYEHFERWIFEQDRAGNLPDLGEGRAAKSIDVVTRGYVFSEDAKTARYQIQLRLIYEED